MKNIIKIGLVSLVGVFMLTGCGSTYIKVAPGEIVTKTKDIKADKKIAVNIINHTDSTYMGTTHIFRNNQDKFMLQAIAMYALKHNFKYFRIIHPYDSSAKMLTKPEELHAACFNRGGMDILKRSLSMDPGYKCIVNAKHGFFAMAALYYKKPKDVLVVDAQEFINYLKANDMNTDYDKIEEYATYKEFKDFVTK